MTTPPPSVPHPIRITMTQAGGFRIPTWPLLTVWLLTLSMFGTGCLSRPALVRQTFALESPSLSSVAAKRSKGVLALRSCEVSPLFEGQAFVYRIGTESYELDPYAGFLVPPSRALAIPVRTGLRNSGVFIDVTEPGSLLRPDQLLEINVSELYGDFRKPAQPVAVLSMRFVFFKTVAGTPPAVSFEKNYTRRLNLPENSAASLVAGWNKALAEIMNEVVSDLPVAP